MKIIRNIVSRFLLAFVWVIFLFWWCFADKTSSKIEQITPVGFLDQMYYDANKQHSTEVQDTKFDTVTSHNTQVSYDSRMTLSNTIGWLVSNLHHYLQYVMYAWFVLATIFIIINWLKFVTKWAGYTKDFKKNIIYAIVWVWLLVAFYYVIDVFVALANMFLEK